MSNMTADKNSKDVHLKNPICYDEQVKQIAKKGFIIEDSNSCKEFLKQANYYRLLAYLLPFKKKDGTYFQNVSFKRIQRIYEFDSRLRSLIFQIIEQIEFYLRTQISYYLSFKYGGLGYSKKRDPSIFNSQNKLNKFKKNCKLCIKHNQKTLVVKHHKNKYKGEFPLWVIIEFFTMGMLSFLYADLSTQDKKRIAEDSFNTTGDHLESWLRCLTDLRNRCAHYSRLYDWDFSAIPKKPYNITYTFNERKLFSQILMLKYLYPDKEQWNNEISVKLKTLLDEYLPDISLEHIGFPENWKELLKA